VSHRSSFGVARQSPAGGFAAAIDDDGTAGSGFHKCGLDAEYLTPHGELFGSLLSIVGNANIDNTCQHVGIIHFQKKKKIHFQT
jgi:hypothetical protein